MTASPRLEASLLLARALQRDGGWLLAHDDEPVTAEAASALDALLQRRAVGEPLAYVLGEAWFFGRRFMVTSDVLVPRPETELVVEAALSDLNARRSHGSRGLRACDVGTGSGAIAVTLAAEIAELFVTASDASEAALRMAEENARRLGVGERVGFAHGDLGEPLRAYAPFDCVVANLPYVPSLDVPSRPDPVGFEPRLAVDGGTDGLAVYRRLVRQLPMLMAPGATAFFEAAPLTVEPLAEMVARALPHAHLEVGEDYAGLERWVAVVLPEVPA